GACGSQESSELGEQEVKELVHDYSVGSYENESASITSDELIVTSHDGEETTYALPEDEFFVSIAPFMKTTHDCAIHSLTGCQGELIEKEFDVLIEDGAGNVVVDKTISSFENGFIDLWLPREETFQVKIAYDG